MGDSPTPFAPIGLYGDFVTQGSAQDTTALGGGLPQILSSNSIDTALTTSGTHTITVYVTSQNLTQPTGLTAWSSSFTSNALPAGWTVTTQTYFDPTNGLYNATTDGLDPDAVLLRSATFNAIGTQGPFVDVQNVAAPFSVTEVYTITGFWDGTDNQDHLSNDTINLRSTALPVPEPASLAILGSALLGFGLIRRRRQPS